MVPLAPMLFRHLARRANALCRRLVPTPGDLVVMMRGLSTQAACAGALSAFVGVAGSFAVVVQGLRAAGASAGQAASGLMAVAVVMGLTGIVLSLRYRMPVGVAWSTPGAALLVGSDTLPGGFPEAVGSFIIAGGLVALAGVIRPLGRAVAAIPGPIANAMLAGVLLGLCLAPFRAIAVDPLLGLPIVLAWAVAGRLHRVAAVPAALLAFIVVMAVGLDLPTDGLARIAAAIPPPVVTVWPVFSLAGLVGVALPLFLVTMASQNIPGIAVMAANGFRPPPGPLFSATGAASLLAAPVGGHSVCLAAITAALCAGPDAHPDPARRYWAVIVAGGVMVLFGLLAGALTTVIGFAPAILIEAVAGLALIGAFVAAITAAFAPGGDAPPAGSREAAAVTFLVTASGLSIGGISGAFWGLLGGALMLGLCRLGRRAG